MKNLIKSFKENKNKLKSKLITISTSIGVTLMLGTSRVCAASGTESIDSFINFACDWLTKIGGVVALVGGVMFALGWQREDAERKIKRTYDTYGWVHVGCYCSIKKTIWTIKEEEIYNWMEL